MSWSTRFDVGFSILDSFSFLLKFIFLLNKKHFLIRDFLLGKRQKYTLPLKTKGRGVGKEHGIRHKEM